MARKVSRAIERRREKAKSKQMELDETPRVRNLALRILYSERPPVHVGGNVYKVASESEVGRKYNVTLGRRVTCDCRYWRNQKRVCKHIAAARLDRGGRRKVAFKDSDRQVVPNQYQNAPGYDAAKATESVAVPELLRCLTANVPYSASLGPGRPSAHVGDILFCHVMAAYYSRPSRRAVVDPEWYAYKGYLVEAVPAHSTLRKYR